MAVAVRLERVVRGFDTPAGRETALRGVDFEARPHELVVLVGKSGSGKSVLLHLMAGLDRPTAGSIQVGETLLDGLSDGALTQWRRHAVGIVLQDHQLLPGVNIRHNVQLVLELAALVPRKDRVDLARERLAQVGMLNYESARPASLSVGQRRRVALAQALANDPMLVLADEPTLGLDSLRASAVFRLFHQLAEAGKTVIVATRDYELASRAKRAVVLSDGEIVNQHVTEAFATLDLVQLNTAVARLKPRRYAPGEVVVRQGERADRFFIIARGEAEVLIDIPDGAPVRVNTLRPGQYFGEVALVRGIRRTATVRAGQETGLDVLALGKDVFAQLLEQSEPTRERIDSVIRERIAIAANA